MIIPSNRNNLNREEQNNAFGGGLMKKFLHQQFDSPYYVNESDRFQKNNYSVQDKMQRDHQNEFNQQRIEKRRLQQLEYQSHFQPKNEAHTRIRSSNTFQSGFQIQISGIPVHPINSNIDNSPKGSKFKNEIKNHNIRDLTRQQNLQMKQQPYNILTGVFRQMVEVPTDQKQAFSERWSQNNQSNKPPKSMLFY